MNAEMRLRQICLVAYDLQARCDELCALLGLSVAFRDPAVGRYGLANIVTPVGDDFLEIVSPTRDGTAAGRYLERRGGDGGYMVILQGDDAREHRNRLEARQVRAVEVIDRPQYQATHFHPSDTGGVLLSIDSVPGGDWQDPDCEWPPAGPQWREHKSRPGAISLAGAELQSEDPEAMAQQWSALLALPVRPDRSIALANARLRFVPATDARGRGLAAIEVRVADPAAILERARRLSLGIDRNTVTACGTRIRLLAPNDH